MKHLKFLIRRIKKWRGVVSHLYNLYPVLSYLVVICPTRWFTFSTFEFYTSNPLCYGSYILRQIVIIEFKRVFHLGSSSFINRSGLPLIFLLLSSSYMYAVTSRLFPFTLSIVTMPYTPFLSFSAYELPIESNFGFKTRIYTKQS